MDKKPKRRENIQSYTRNIKLESDKASCTYAMKLQRNQNSLPSLWIGDQKAKL